MAYTHEFNERVNNLAQERIKNPTVMTEFKREKTFVSIMRQVYRQRTKLGLTYEDVAKKASSSKRFIPANVIEAIECGNVDMKLSVLVMIAKALEVTLEIQFKEDVGEARKY